jgi:hypothetical protein
MELVQCNTELKRTVPLTKVVGAAIVDLHEDLGRLQQIATHHAARGLKKITRETLKTGLRKVTLLVNQNTWSATLPPDFDSEEGVYIIDRRGFKVPLKSNNKIVDYKNIEDLEPPELCPKCNQNTQICQDLTVTEETTLVVVNGITAQQTVIKKLYPDGSYYLETITPVWDIDSAGIIYTTAKEFITKLDLKDCGCLVETPANLEQVRCLCPDVWCTYYTPCDNNCIVDYGGYRIFEETGLIYFDKPHSFEKVYLEYWGFMVKKNGQYHVPEIAFETLVNFIKFKWVENKRNVPAWERQWTFNQYTRERANMEKVMGRIGLAQIIQSIGLIPKFDLDYTPEMWCGGSTVSFSTVNGSAAAAAAAAEACEVAIAATADSESDTEGCNEEPLPEVECPCPPCDPSKQPFQLAKVADVGDGPVSGTNTYQHNDLINALDVNIINVNNTPETVQAAQFTFDNVTGTIARFQGDGVTPNMWQPGDVLVVNYAKIEGITIIGGATPQTMFMSGDGTFILPDGYMIDKILIKPTIADTVRIGTTLGGDEIMMDKVMVPNVYSTNGVNGVDVYADGASVTIYFTGFTASAQIKIYLLSI